MNGWVVGKHEGGGQMWSEWNAEPRWGRSHDEKTISTKEKNPTSLQGLRMECPPKVGLVKSRPLFQPFVPRSRGLGIAKYSRKLQKGPMLDTNVTEAQRLCGQECADRTMTRIRSRPHGKWEFEEKSTEWTLGDCHTCLGRRSEVMISA